MNILIDYINCIAYVIGLYVMAIGGITILIMIIRSFIEYLRLLNKR